MLWIQLKGAELEGHDVHSPIGIKLHMECSELVIGNFYKKNVLKNSEKKEA